MLLLLGTEGAEDRESYPLNDITNMAHGNSIMCISEEILTALMKKIFAEELPKQQQSLLKLSNANFEITMKEIKKY